MTCHESGPSSQEDIETGVAWLSSARVVRCWVKSRNERNPHRMLAALSRQLLRNCPCKREEGGDDVKSAWPLRLGLHTCYNGRRQSAPIPRGGGNRTNPPSVRIAGCNSPA